MGQLFENFKGYDVQATREEVRQEERAHYEPLLAAKDAQIAERDSVIAERDSEIAKLNARIRELEAARAEDEK